MNRNSNTKVVTAISNAATGNRSPIEFFVSTSSAAAPPTWSAKPPYVVHQLLRLLALVYQVSGSGYAVSAVLAAWMLATIVAAPFGAVLADWMPRRDVL